MFHAGTLLRFRSRSRARDTFAIRKTLRRNRNRWNEPPEVSAEKTEFRKSKPRSEAAFQLPRMTVRPKPASTASKLSVPVGDSSVPVAAFAGGGGGRPRRRRRCSGLDRRKVECRNKWRNLKGKTFLGFLYVLAIS